MPETPSPERIAEVRARFVDRLAESMGRTVPADVDGSDPVAMLAYLRDRSAVDPVIAHAVRLIDAATDELDEYKASTAETLALNRKIGDRLRSDLDRLSTRCRFFEDATRRLLDGRTLTEAEAAHARRLLAGANR